MRKLLLTLFLLSMTAACHGDKGVILSAPPGHYDAMDLGRASETIEIEAKIMLTKLDRSAEWPPAAYVGFYDETDRNNKFQFLIIKNKKNDNYVIAGYRLIEEGREVMVASISRFALHAKVQHKLKLSAGNIQIHLLGHKPVEIVTKMKRVIPYISVSSGAAAFEVTLNNKKSAADVPVTVR